MRVLLQNSLFHPNMVGGAEQSTLLLARELSRRGHEVDVVSTTGSRGKGEPTLASRIFDGISGLVYEATPGGTLSLISKDEASPPGLLSKAWHHVSMLRVPRWREHIATLCRDGDYDVFHTNTIVGQSGLIWGAARRAGVRVLHTLRDYQLLCPRTTLLRSSGVECVSAPIPCKILRAAQKPLTGEVDIVTAPSRFVLDRHLNEGHFPNARAEVVANASDPPVTPRPERAGDSLRLVYLGQLDEHKGVALLMEVLEPLFERGELPHLRLALAGDGPMRSKVEAFAARYPARVRYAGFVAGEEKDALLRGADALILPSVWNDNFPRVMLDAFRWALPVLGSRRGGIPEVVEDGHTGYLFEPEAQSLLDVLERVAADPASLLPLGQAAHEESARYGVDAQVDRFLELYEELSSDRSRGVRSSQDDDA